MRLLPKIVSAGFLYISFLCFATAPALAQSSFTLTPNDPVVGQGQTLTFSGFLQNNTSESLDFVSGVANFTGTDTSFSLDDTFFVLNFPTPLASGATYEELFLLNAPANALQGDYTVSYTLGAIGTSGTTYTIFSNNALFAVTEVTAVPESPSAHLLALGSLMSCAIFNRIRGTRRLLN